MKIKNRVNIGTLLHSGTPGRLLYVDDNKKIAEDGSNIVYDVNFNLFIGKEAFLDNKGQQNVGIGYIAGKFTDHTTGEENWRNVYIGYAAGAGLTVDVDNTGYWNVYIGAETGAYNTTGNSNTFVGLKSGFSNTTGSNNTALGLDSLRLNQTGNNNLALGYHAGDYNNASNNSFIGTWSGYGVTTGYGNVMVGDSAGRTSNPIENILIGQLSGYKVTGASNVIIGTTSGENTTTGAQNIFIGGNAGRTNITGYGNVYIGNESGRYATGTENVYIGYFAGWRQEGESNTFMVDNQARADKSTGQNNALFYGTFSSLAANQLLTIRAKTGIGALSQGSLTEQFEVNGNLFLTNDNDKLLLGAGKDLSIYYDGSDSHIKSDNISASDIKIACGANKTLELQTPVYNDINYNALFALPGAIAPDLIVFYGSGGLKGYAFNGVNLTETLQFGAQELLHSYKEGTDISLHVHWMPTTTNTGNVKWQFEYNWQNIDGTFGSPSIVSVLDSADGTAWKHSKTDEITITGTSKLIGSVLHIRLFRDPTDAADTYAYDAAVLSIGFHYQINTLGSRQLNTK